MTAGNATCGRCCILQILARIIASCRCPRAGIACAHEGKRLMPVESAQLDNLSIEREPMIRKRSLAKADAAGIFINDASVPKQPDIDRVEMGMLQIPELHAAQARE